MQLQTEAVSELPVAIRLHLQVLLPALEHSMAYSCRVMIVTAYASKQRGILFSVMTALWQFPAMALLHTIPPH